MFHESDFNSRARLRSGKHVLCSLFAMTLTAPAFADTLYVDPVLGSDPLNDCLTEASPCQSITTAISVAIDGDDIVLAAGTYYESGIHVPIDVTLTGAPGAIVDAAGFNRHFLVETAGEVKMTDLELVNGDAVAVAENGGAIKVVLGSLELKRVDVFDSTAVHGGAVSCEDDCSGLTVKQCDFSGNVADYGGALSTSAVADTTVHKSNFDGNDSSFLGGAIYQDGLQHDDPKLVVYDSQFSGNTSGSGGAIYSLYGDVSVYRSSFYANAADNSGGGMAFSGADNVLKIANATFAENFALYTGAITTGAGTTAKLSNLTFNNNSSTMSMQDFFMGGDADVLNSIITHEAVGGGVFIPSCGAATGITMTGDNNLMDKFCETPTSATFNAGPLSAGSLGALDLYGATTLSYKLLAGSNAIDAGASSCPGPDGNPMPQDQRRRTRTAGAACDVGAFEKQ